jgi:CRISPR-associated protein Csn2
MKIKIFPFENDIDFSICNFNTLEVLNKKLFINIVESITNNYQGLEGIERISIIKENKEVDLSKNILLVSDILKFDLNEKKVLNKLYSEMDSIIKNDAELFKEAFSLFNFINKKVDIILEDFNIDTFYNEDFIFQDYLKMIGLKICVEEPISFVQKIYQIMDITRELLDNKLIILINSKAYYEIDNLIEIIKYTNYNKNNLLFIECNPGVKIPGENKYVIDDEYEEFFEFK